MLQRANRRSQIGAMYALCGVGFLIITIGVCAVALDIGHCVVVKGELQKTTDAAAIAGAEDLFRNPTRVEASATTIAGMNTADGRSVSNKTPETTVDIQILPQDPNNMRRVQVTASMRIRHMFSAIFGRPTDVITARSVAGGSGLLTEMPGSIAFPLAVSIDAAPGTYHGFPLSPSPNAFTAKPINQAKIGDPIVLYLNSQQYKNAAFTTFTQGPASGGLIHILIDESLGLASRKSVVIPEVKAGDYIFLNNGIDGEKKLAQDPDYSALLSQNEIFLPVISGNPPYNQSRECLGFIAVKVTGVQNNTSAGVVEQINCILVQGLSPGTGGVLPSSGNQQNDQAMQRLALSPVKLLL